MKKVNFSAMKTKLKFRNYLNFFRFGKWMGLVCMIMLAASCVEDPIGQQSTDGKAPSPLKNAYAEGLPGGGLVIYELPDDDPDISYVRGEYEFAGKQYVVRSSVYTDHFTVEGLTGTNPVTVKLYVVDHSENSSTPIEVSFTPTMAPFATIGNTVKITPFIGGIIVTWENPDRTPDIGVVLLVYDTITKTMKEHDVSFNITCAAYFPFDTVENTFAAYVTDKWGHYSDTTMAVVKPVVEEWLDRTKMRGYPIGNDAPLDNPDVNAGYYSGAERLFDGLSRGLGVTNGSDISSKNFGVKSLDGSMPIYYTFDLGVEAVVNRFWIEPRGHSTRGRFAFGYNNSQDPTRLGGGSVYNWDIWGTTVDFGDSTSVDFKPADDPYWTQEQWKQDPNWKYMGNYTHRRPSNYLASPENPGPWTGDDWNSDLNLTYAPPSMDNPTNFIISELGIGGVRFLRWQFNRSWSNEACAFMAEMWYWGGIISEVPKQE
jgi:hypothetical protein